jgi:chitin disaccharide deacetylase
MKVNKKKIGLIVCADDFGASPAINAAIVRLLEMKRISAVSCLVTGDAWAQGAAFLKRYRGAVDLGLHLVYDAVPFNKAVTMAYAGGMDRNVIVRAFKDQLDRFVKEIGDGPDYIDGHKHIHQLPVFRTALFELIDAADLQGIYIRNSAMDVGDILERKISVLKNMTIAWTGHALKSALRRKGISTNNDLLGIYDFKTTRNPGDILEKFLESVRKSNSILVTHPGPELNRLEEMKYLQSDQYQTAMSRHGVYLKRFSLQGETIE